MQGKVYKNYEEFSIAFDNTPEEVLRSETYTLLKAYNNIEQQLQQYKQQIDELKQWLEDEISKKEKCMFINDKYVATVHLLKKEALEEVLSKLKERDEK